MAAKTEFLQIRVSAEQKAALRRAARRAGLGISAYVLSRVASPAADRAAAILAALESEEDDRRYLLADLHDLLVELTSGEFSDAVADLDPSGLSPFYANSVASMVEHAAASLGVAPPAWTTSVGALAEPWFATDLKSLRPWLLVSAPVAFKRRNLFVDSTLGDRV
jgi:uncharacterized protein (DUF1778 family)